MYVKERSADSIWDTALAFLVMNSPYIPSNFGGNDKAAGNRWDACLYMLITLRCWRSDCWLTGEAWRRLSRDSELVRFASRGRGPEPLVNKDDPSSKRNPCITSSLPWRLFISFILTSMRSFYRWPYWHPPRKNLYEFVLFFSSTEGQRALPGSNTFDMMLPITVGSTCYRVLLREPGNSPIVFRNVTSHLSHNKHCSLNWVALMQHCIALLRYCITVNYKASITNMCL